jgi:hypothetical protein
MDLGALVIEPLNKLAAFATPIIASPPKILLLLAAGLIVGLAFKAGKTVAERAGTFPNAIIALLVGYGLLRTGIPDIGRLFLVGGALLLLIAFLKPRGKKE